MFENIVVPILLSVCIVGFIGGFIYVSYSIRGGDNKEARAAMRALALLEDGDLWDPAVMALNAPPDDDDESEWSVIDVERLSSAQTPEACDDAVFGVDTNPLLAVLKARVKRAAAMAKHLEDDHAPDEEIHAMEAIAERCRNALECARRTTC